MQPRAAIFDFDGTIADTFDQVVGLLNSLASEFGYRAAEPDEIELLRAMTPGEVAKRLGVAWHKLPLIVARARKELSHKMASVSPFDGIGDALAELRSRGVQVGLLTSNTRRNVDLFLARHPIAFDFISTGSGLWSKHRRLARVMRQYGLSREHTAYVGDEIRDIEAARALDIRAVSVAWGYTNPKLLETQQPDRVIARPPELVEGLLAVLSSPPSR